MQWVHNVSDALATLNILLAIYNVLLLNAASRYHTMALALLDGAWPLREWPVNYMIAARTRQRDTFRS